MSTTRDQIEAWKEKAQQVLREAQEESSRLVEQSEDLMDHASQESERILYQVSLLEEKLELEDLKESVERDLPQLSWAFDFWGSRPLARCVLPYGIVLSITGVDTCYVAHLTVESRSSYRSLRCDSVRTAVEDLLEQMSKLSQDVNVSVSLLTNNVLKGSV
jgi:hypothetical protein